MLMQMRFRMQKDSIICNLYVVLVNYLSVMNVIVSCDDSASEFNIKEYNRPNSNGLIRDYSEFWHGRRRNENSHEANIQKDEVLAKKQADSTKIIRKTLDLASNSYIVKNINMNLRPEKHRFQEKILKLGVLLPADPLQVFSLVKVLPVLDLAILSVTRPDGPLPGWKIVVHYRDTKCSPVDGPLAAFSFYFQGLADVFFGPGCENVIAPVAKYASIWGIPVLTTGELTEEFGHEISSYPTLIRMIGSYTQARAAINEIFEEFNWRQFGILYHENNLSDGIGNSSCFYTLRGIFTVLTKKAVEESNVPIVSFDETKTKAIKFKEMLHTLSSNSRIIILCANPRTVREIMIAADDLKMVSSGEYVFFNIKLFSNLASASTKEPWKVEGDTEERNEKARRAYSAVLTVTSPAPENKQYMRFSDQIKNQASTKYHYTFDRNAVVSTFVAAYYDAVILYALALNDTMQHAAASRGQLDNATVMRNMRNRTFQGITGKVVISKNGDRVASYCLLDMNPVTSKFEVVATYEVANSSLQFIPDRRIHWPGGRTSPPPDTPKCGFDGSLCPDNSLPGCAILSIILSFAVVVLATLLILFYKYTFTCSFIFSDRYIMYLCSNIGIE